MTINRAATRGDLTAVLLRAALQDPRLSWEATGILAGILSRPRDWHTSQKRLVEERPRAQINSIRRSLSELETCGYLVRRRVQGGVEWDLTDDPSLLLSDRNAGQVTSANLTPVDSDTSQPDTSQISTTYRELDFDRGLEEAQGSNNISSGTAAPSPDAPLPDADLPSDPQGEAPIQNADETTTRKDVTDLCLHLQALIVANGSKKPRITKTWLDEARRMIDIDGRNVDRALALMDWAQQSSFWRANVLSMPTFRQKYDQLRLQALAEWEHNHGVAPTTHDRESYPAKVRRQLDEMAAAERAASAAPVTVDAIVVDDQHTPDLFSVGADLWPASTSTGF